MSSGSEFLGLWQILLLLVVIALPFIYQSSHVFKYYFKMITYYFLAMIIGLGVIIYSLWKPKDPQNHKFVTLSVKYLLMKVLGMDITLRGQEHLDNDKPAIMVVNHQSSIDMLPLFFSWPRNCVVISKREVLWFSGPFGLGAWLCGTIWIDRLNPDSARGTMNSTAQLIKDKKYKVAMFPEGTRNHKGSLLPFKKGAFHLAVQGQVPIIPLVISSYDNFYSKRDKRFNEGNVLVEALPPITTEGLSGSDVTELSENTRNLMLKAFENISAEVKTMK